MADLQVHLRCEPGWANSHVVCSVPGDDGAWEVIYDGLLPSSNLTLGLSWLVTLWRSLTMAE